MKGRLNTGLCLLTGLLAVSVRLTLSAETSSIRVSPSMVPVLRFSQPSLDPSVVQLVTSATHNTILLTPTLEMATATQIHTMLPTAAEVSLSARQGMLNLEGFSPVKAVVPSQSLVDATPSTTSLVMLQTKVPESELIVTHIPGLVLHTPTLLQSPDTNWNTNSQFSNTVREKNNAPIPSASSTQYMASEASVSDVKYLRGAEVQTAGIISVAAIPQTSQTTDEVSLTRTAPVTSSIQLNKSSPTGNKDISPTGKQDLSSSETNMEEAVASMIVPAATLVKGKPAASENVELYSTKAVDGTKIRDNILLTSSTLTVPSKTLVMPSETVTNRAVIIVSARRLDNEPSINIPIQKAASVPVAVGFSTDTFNPTSTNILPNSTVSGVAASTTISVPTRGETESTEHTANTNTEPITNIGTVVNIAPTLLTGKKPVLESVSATESIPILSRTRLASVRSTSTATTATTTPPTATTTPTTMSSTELAQSSNTVTLNELSLSPPPPPPPSPLIELEKATTTLPMDTAATPSLVVTSRTILVAPPLQKTSTSTDKPTTAVTPPPHPHPPPIYEATKAITTTTDETTKNTTFVRTTMGTERSAPSWIDTLTPTLAETTAETTDNIWPPAPPVITASTSSWSTNATSPAATGTVTPSTRPPLAGLSTNTTMAKEQTQIVIEGMTTPSSSSSSTMIAVGMSPTASTKSIVTETVLQTVTETEESSAGTTTMTTTSPPPSPPPTTTTVERTTSSHQATVSMMPSNENWITRNSTTNSAVDVKDSIEMLPPPFPVAEPNNISLINKKNISNSWANRPFGVRKVGKKSKTTDSQITASSQSTGEHLVNYPPAESNNIALIDENNVSSSWANRPFGVRKVGKKCKTANSQVKTTRLSTDESLLANYPLAESNNIALIRENNVSTSWANRPFGVRKVGKKCKTASSQVKTTRLSTVQPVTNFTQNPDHRTVEHTESPQGNDVIDESPAVIMNTIHSSTVNTMSDIRPHVVPFAADAVGEINFTNNLIIIRDRASINSNTDISQTEVLDSGKDKTNAVPVSRIPDIPVPPTHNNIDIDGHPYPILHDTSMETTTVKKPERQVAESSVNIGAAIAIPVIFICIVILIVAIVIWYRKRGKDGHQLTHISQEIPPIVPQKAPTLHTVCVQREKQEVFKQRPETNPDTLVPSQAEKLRCAVTSPETTSQSRPEECEMSIGVGGTVNDENSLSNMLTTLYEECEQRDLKDTDKGGPWQTKL